MNNEYKKGWDNSLQFRAEWRRLQQSSGAVGLPLMMLGGIWVASLTAMLFTVDRIANYQPLVWGYGFGIAVSVAGFFLNRRESRVFRQRYTDFCLKWADKVPTKEK